jgi:signal transduction histidine kinase
MSIKNKLFLLLVFFAVIPVLMLGVLVFANAKRLITTVRTAQLNSIADLKKDKIETFFNERRQDIRSAQSFYNIKTNLPILIQLHQEGADIARAKSYVDLDRQMQGYQKSYGYLNVILTDTMGRVVYASNAAENLRPGRAVPYVDYFQNARKEIYFADVFRNALFDDRLEMIAAGPLHDFQGRFIGEIVVEFDMEPILKFISDTTGLGKTGEVVISRKESDSVVFITPLQYDPEAALKKKVPLSARTAYPSQRAVQGENASGIALDYNNAEVLAAWRYIPLLRWGLVTKIDTKEAFAPVAQLEQFLILAILCIIFFAAAAAVWIAKNVTTPILSLQKGAETIAAGDLSHRVGIEKNDEIGRLARAFDTMSKALAADRAKRAQAEEEVKTLNVELVRKLAELETVNKELEAFSYSVSHDLRAPLCSIDGFTQALQEDYGDKLDAQGREFLHLVRSGSKLMSQLIDDLLMLSRVSRGDMERKQVDMSMIAQDIADNLHKTEPDRKVIFVIQEGLSAWGDDRLLHLAVTNLMNNAWKFTKAHATARIEFGAFQHDGHRTFFIKDDGAGFNMAYSNKLFNPFQRLHTEREFPGTGIGLATVKRIIQRHGGRVWMEGEVEKGATIFFTL